VGHFFESISITSNMILFSMDFFILLKSCSFILIIRLSSFSPNSFYTQNKKDKNYHLILSMHADVTNGSSPSVKVSPLLLKFLLSPLVEVSVLNLCLILPEFFPVILTHGAHLHLVLSQFVIVIC